MPKRYSHSLLGSFRNCPRQYKFRYIERAKVRHRLNANTELGRIVHLVLADLYELGSHDKLWPLDDALKRYSDEWDKLIGRDIQVSNQSLAVDDFISTGRRMIESFYQENQPFNDGTLLGAECNITFDLPGTLFRILVKIDRLWKRPDGVIEIIDYKTGRQLPHGGRDANFFDQMGLYQLGVQSTWPQFEQIELVQPYLRLSETIRHRASEEELDELTEQVRCTIEEIKTAERLDAFPTHESGLCHYCDYFELCPAKRHERLLEAVEEIGDEETGLAQTALGLTTEYLQTYTSIKSLEERLKVVREDLERLAAELKTEKFKAPEGEISLKLTTEEKFITKSEDEGKFAELTRVAREFGFEDYFSLDSRALMKEIYSKKRLDTVQLQRLEEFVKVVKGSRIRVKVASDNDDEDDK